MLLWPSGIVWPRLEVSSWTRQAAVKEDSEVLDRFRYLRLLSIPRLKKRLVGLIITKNEILAILPLTLGGSVLFLFSGEKVI